MTSRPTLANKVFGKSWRGGWQLLIWLAIAANAFPFYWMLVTSFKDKVGLYEIPPTLVPVTWTLENYRLLFTTTQFGTYFLNSVIIATSSTALALFAGSLAGYALSRFKMTYVVRFGQLILISKMLPAALLVVPLYVYVVALGFMNSPLSLIIANTSFTLPITVWLLKSYFDAVPVDIEESAWIDGCSRIGGLFRIVLPSTIPGVIAVGAINFTAAWNEFLFALVFISSERYRTLPLGLSLWIGEDVLFNWGMLLAAAVLMTLPVLAIYFLVQRWMMAGLMDGAMKG